MATLQHSTPQIARVALYARVSTLNGQSPQLQLDELRQYAQARGWTVYSEYCDLGVSGSKDSRPELNRMIADAHARKFDGIAVWKLDRLGRSLKHLVTTIEDLEHYGVSFVSLRDNLDLSTPAGRLMMHVIGAMAEFERELIRERVNAGIKSAQARGVRFGRPKIYCSALKIAALREQGVPWVEVARKLGAGKGTVQRVYARHLKEEAA
jgi:DNA invertase Pin-like site-specific DNA recombinase